jgi:hypothetical protein
VVARACRVTVARQSLWAGVSVLASDAASLRRVQAVLGRLPKTEDMFDVCNTDLDIKPMTVEAENRIVAFIR